MHKNVVIGLDGLDPGLVNKWIDELPNIGRLIQEGTFKKMKSTIPPITVPAWMSMFSGKDPGELDAFDFQFFDKTSKKFRIFNSNYWKKHMIWSSSTKKWCVIDVPGTYPPYEIKGYVKGGFLSINSKETFPKGLMQEFEKDNSPLETDDCTNAVSFSQKSAILKKNLTENMRFVRWLFSSKEWDNFIFVIRLTDETMHIAENIEQIKDAYKFADAQIKQFIDDSLQGKYSLFITSDHGCKEVSHKFYLNNWLMNTGYLYIDRNTSFVKENIIRFSNVLLNLGMKPLLEAANKAFSSIKGKSFFQPTLPITEQAIDWNKTKAFAQVTGASSFIGIWINPEKNSKKIKNNLISDLKTIKEIVNVYKKEDIYSQTQAKNLPDLIVQLDKEFVALSGISPETITKRKAFVHDQYGVFISSRTDLNRANADMLITDFARHLTDIKR